MASQGQNPPVAHSRPLPPPPPDWQPPPQRRRGKRAGRAFAILIVLLLLLYVLFYTPLGIMLFSGLTGNSYAKSSTFTLNRVITIDTNREINYLCDIPIPQSISYSGYDIQTVSDTSFSPAGTLNDKFGNSWIEWVGTVSGSVTLSITTQAKVNTVVWDIDGKSSGMASDIPVSMLEVQTGDEWEILDNNENPTGEYMIWPSHPSIRNLANAITSEELTVYDNARGIYSYIRKNIEYSTVPGAGPKPSLQTLHDGTGDCDDQSMLLISLLRSAGIPSWLAFGALYDGVRGQWGAHAWAELYIPMNGGGGENAVIDPANGEFLVRNCNRLEEWKSDGVGEHLADYYHLLSYNYSAMPNQPPPSVSISDSYHGEYHASSERVYAAVFDMASFIMPGALREGAPLSEPRKVF